MVCLQTVLLIVGWGWVKANTNTNTYFVKNRTGSKYDLAMQRNRANLEKNSMRN